MFREREKRVLMEVEEERENQILEINLISAQGLKTPSGNLRRMQTYALAWVDPSNKLRTRIDRVGAENPTWNDKFLFRVSSDFIASETSGVIVEIYAVGYIRDYLIGTVRFLLSSCLGKFPASADGIGTPAFTAVQIRRPSGRFHGVLNIAASVCSSSSSMSDFDIFKGSSAVSFSELMGDEIEKEKDDDRRRRRRLSRVGSKRSEQSSGGESCDFDLSSMDLSDGTESTTSSSSTASNALKEWNGVRTEMAGKLKEMKPEGVGGGGLLCGLLLQRKIRFCPSDQNLRSWEESLENQP